jgi:hypothetical protein
LKYLDPGFRRDDESFGISTYYEIIKFDGSVKSRKSRRSRAGGSPEFLDLTGFPLSLE